MRWCIIIYLCLVGMQGDESNGGFCQKKEKKSDGSTLVNLMVEKVEGK